MTSSAVNGAPSENLQSGRSASVYLRPSGETFQDEARAGSVRWVWRLMWTRSACIVPITSREVVSTARVGLRVLGSVGSASVIRPPGRPISDDDGADCARDEDEIASNARVRNIAASA